MKVLPCPCSLRLTACTLRAGKRAKLSRRRPLAGLSRHSWIYSSQQKFDELSEGIRRKSHQGKQQQPSVRREQQQQTHLGGRPQPWETSGRPRRCSYEALPQPAGRCEGAVVVVAESSEGPVVVVGSAADVATGSTKEPTRARRSRHAAAGGEDKDAMDPQPPRWIRGICWQGCWRRPNAKVEGSRSPDLPPGCRVSCGGEDR